MQKDEGTEEQLSVLRTVRRLVGAVVWPDGPWLHATNTLVLQIVSCRLQDIGLVHSPSDVMCNAHH